MGSYLWNSMEIKMYLTDLKNTVTFFFLKLFSTLQVELFLKMLSILCKDYK